MDLNVCGKSSFKLYRMCPRCVHMNLHMDNQINDEDVVRKLNMWCTQRRIKNNSHKLSQSIYTINEFCGCQGGSTITTHFVLAWKQLSVAKMCRLSAPIKLLTTTTICKRKTKAWSMLKIVYNTVTRSHLGNSHNIWLPLILMCIRVAVISIKCCSVFGFYRNWIENLFHFFVINLH